MFYTMFLFYLHWIAHISAPFAKDDDLQNKDAQIWSHLKANSSSKEFACSGSEHRFPTLMIGRGPSG